MEYYFENVYTDSEEMIQEINAKIGTRKIRRWIWVYLAIAVFYLLFFLPGGGFLSWLIFFVCIGYIVWLLCLPLYRTKKYFKKMKEYYGEIPQIVVRFGEDAVTTTYTDSCWSVPYEKITRIRFLTHSIVLQANGVSTVAVSPSGFTKGTLPEFRAFVKQKCPNAKLPDWQW